MDEKEVLAKAAEELTREGDIEEVTGSLTKQRDAAFPTLLFLMNLAKDVVDFPVDMTSLTGFTWIFYIVLVAAPVWTANLFYMWGKLSWVKQRAIGGGMRFVLKRYKRAIFRRLVIMGATSLAPIANMLFPQCLFIVLAHNSHKKLVAGLLEGVEIFATATATGNYRLAAELAGKYAEEAAQNIVRQARMADRVGDRFGEQARATAQRMEGNVTRVARGGAASAVSRFNARRGATGETGNPKQ